MSYPGLKAINMIKTLSLGPFNKAAPGGRSLSFIIVYLMISLHYVLFVCLVFFMWLCLNLALKINYTELPNIVVITK